MWIYWFIGLLVMSKFENALSQSENTRKQYYIRNDEHQQEVIPSEYLSFLQELSALQGVKPQKLSQAAPQNTKNYQKNVANIQYQQYEPKPDKEIRYVTEKEYAELIESEQKSKPLQKNRQQIHQQHRFKQQQTRFNKNLREKIESDQVLSQNPKQVKFPFDGSSFEDEIKHLESSNRPINKQVFNSNAQQSAYNTRQDEIYQDYVDNTKTTKARNKTHPGEHLHRELDQSKLPFLDKDRVFSQSEFQAFVDAGYPVVAVPVVQEASSRPNY